MYHLHRSTTFSGIKALTFQNNGRPAHQVPSHPKERAINTDGQIVDHVHFHMIPKSAEAGDSAGLVVGWPSKSTASSHEYKLTRISSSERCMYSQRSRGCFLLMIIVG